MKKIAILTSLMATFFVFALFAHAQDYTPLAPLPIGAGVTTPTTYTLSSYLSGMLQLLIALGAGVSILIAIIGGTQYVAAGIAPSAKQDAKERIFNAFIGLALVLTSYLILNSINPGLVQFNFSLPTIGTSPAPTTTGGGVHAPEPLPTTPLVQPAVYGVATPVNNDAAIAAATAQVQNQVDALYDPGCPSGYTYSTVTIDWDQQISIQGPLHTMNHCYVKAFQFTMPNRSEPVQSQTSYATVPKYLSLSQTTYDFSSSLEASGCATTGQNNPIIWNTTGIPMEGVCLVETGATYYLNVRNASSRDGDDNCPAGSTCTFYLAW